MYSSVAQGFGSGYIHVLGRLCLWFHEIQTTSRSTEYLRAQYGATSMLTRQTVKFGSLGSRFQDSIFLILCGQAACAVYCSDT